MIAYYVHHVGRGHADRAAAIAAHLPGSVTGLSSLPPPSTWRGDWVVLPPDDDGSEAVDPTAGGHLHWAPRHHRGLQGRMTVLARWLEQHDPAVLVSDVSVEVTVLTRLLGIPVAAVALPGLRDDPGHQLGYRLADAIIAPWPRLDEAMCVGLDQHRVKVHHVGGLSRLDGRSPTLAIGPGGRRAPLVFSLRGAGGEPSRGLPALPTGWRWNERGPRNWVEDPWPDLCAADVVVTHCGLGALSDVAAARRPAILWPEPRPHEEQIRTARGLAMAGLGLVVDAEPRPDEWPGILAKALDLDVSAWSKWSDGNGAARAAAVIMDVAGAA